MFKNSNIPFKGELRLQRSRRHIDCNASDRMVTKQLSKSNHYDQEIHLSQDSLLEDVGIEDIDVTRPNWQLNSSKLPELDELSADQSHFNWYTPDIIVLRRLLAYSQDVDLIKKVTQQDMENLGNFCRKYQENFSQKKESYEVEYAELAFRIFSHLAENQKKLSENVIKIILEELKQKRTVTITYVTTAVGYLILTKQPLPLEYEEKVAQLLEGGIDIIIKQRLLGYLEILMVAFLAKLELNLSLTDNELKYIKFALLDSPEYLFENEERQGFSSKDDAKKATESYIKWIGFTSYDYQLQDFKKAVIEGKKFSEDALAYLLRESTWNSTETRYLWKIEFTNQIKILEIVKELMLRRQINFGPMQNNLIKILILISEKGYDADFKIKHNATDIACLLLKRDSFDNENEKNTITKIYKKQVLVRRISAIEVLCKHIKHIGVDNFNDKEKWEELIDKLDKDITLSDNDYKVCELSRKFKQEGNYLLFLLRGEIDKIRGLILEIDSACKVTLALVGAAIDNRDISYALEPLSSLLEDVRFPLEAKFNALQAISYFFENKPELIQINVLGIIVEHYLSVDFLELGLPNNDNSGLYPINVITLAFIILCNSMQSYINDVEIVEKVIKNLNSVIESPWLIVIFSSLIVVNETNKENDKANDNVMSYKSQQYFKFIQSICAYVEKVHKQENEKILDMCKMFCNTLVNSLNKENINAEVARLLLQVTDKVASKNVLQAFLTRKLLDLLWVCTVKETRLLLLQILLKQMQLKEAEEFSIEIFHHVLIVCDSGKSNNEFKIALTSLWQYSMKATKQLSEKENKDYINKLKEERNITLIEIIFKILKKKLNTLFKLKCQCLIEIMNNELIYPWVFESDKIDSILNEVYNLKEKIDDEEDCLALLHFFAKLAEKRALPTQVMELILNSLEESLQYSNSEAINYAVMAINSSLKKVNTLQFKPAYDHLVAVAVKSSDLSIKIKVLETLQKLSENNNLRCRFKIDTLCESIRLLDDKHEVIRALSAKIIENQVKNLSTFSDIKKYRINFGWNDKDLDNDDRQIYLRPCERGTQYKVKNPRGQTIEDVVDIEISSFDQSNFKQLELQLLEILSERDHIDKFNESQIMRIINKRNDPIQQNNIFRILSNIHKNGHRFSLESLYEIAEALYDEKMEFSQRKQIATLLEENHLKISDETFKNFNEDEMILYKKVEYIYNIEKNAFKLNKHNEVPKKVKQYLSKIKKYIPDYLKIAAASLPAGTFQAVKAIISHREKTLLDEECFASILDLCHSITQYEFPLPQYLLRAFCQEVSKKINCTEQNDTNKQFAEIILSSLRFHQHIDVNAFNVIHNLFLSEHTSTMLETYLVITKLSLERGVQVGCDVVNKLLLLASSKEDRNQFVIDCLVLILYNPSYESYPVDNNVFNLVEIKKLENDIFNLIAKNDIKKLFNVMLTKQEKIITNYTLISKSKEIFFNLIGILDKFNHDEKNEIFNFFKKILETQKNIEPSLKERLEKCLTNTNNTLINPEKTLQNGNDIDNNNANIAIFIDELFGNSGIFYNLKIVDNMNFYKLNLESQLSFLIKKTGWSSNKIHRILKKVIASHENNSLISCCKMIDTAFRYREFISENEFYEVIEKTESISNFSIELYKHIVTMHLNHISNEKSLGALLDEMRISEINKKNIELMNFLNAKDVQIFLDKITATPIDNPSNQYKSIFLNDEGQSDVSISAWNGELIIQWARSVKENIDNITIKSDDLIQNDACFFECLMVLKQACKLCFDYEPYTVQMITIFILLRYQPKDHGLFAQIETGEGKSLIIAILTAFKILMNKKVDVVTSSPILAKRDVNKFNEFYQLFNKKVESNEDKDNGRDEKQCKSCYQNSIDIVYGNINNFQFDLLRHRFAELETRGSRPFEDIIIDEVDCTLIDENNNVAMLATAIPGIDLFFPVMLLLWDQLKKLDLLTSFICARVDMQAENKTYDQHELAQIIEEFQKMPDDMKENILKIVENYAGKRKDNDNDQFIENSLCSYLETVIDIDSYQIFYKAFREIDEITKNEIIHNKIKVVFRKDDIFYIGYSNFQQNDYTEIAIDRKKNHTLIIFLEELKEDTQIIDADISEQIVKLCVPMNDDLDAQVNITKVKIPAHLKQFYLMHRIHWIQNAMIAFYDYFENFQYKIAKDNDNMQTIIPIDFSSTGVSQMNTNWGDGLHQFLQIKHGLRITPETLTTNYLSNMAFIKNYKSRNIIGITGTLGTERSRQFLGEIYDIEYLQMPTRLFRQLKRLPGLLLNDEDWLEEILLMSTSEAKFNRVVLVIFESIQYASEFKDKLTREHQWPQRFIITYADDQQDSNYFLNHPVKAGSIIISTNLSGRGTDILLSSEAIKNGGLHVCITFLPKNARVQQQAEGRAARRGEPGTSQLVLRLSDVNHVLYGVGKRKQFDCFDSIDEVERLRDQQEENEIENLKKQEKIRIEIKDKLFEKYLTLRNELIFNKKHNHQLLPKFAGELINQQVMACIVRELKGINRDALDELWGLWLKLQNIDNDEVRVMKLFDTFQEQLKKECDKGSHIKNPIYFIHLGHSLLKHANSFIGSFRSDALCKAAIFYYEKAIRLDLHFAYNAIYHKAYALIKKGKNDFVYKKQAKILLSSMKSNLSNGVLHNEELIYQLLDKPQNDLGIQIKQRIEIYRLYMHSIHNCITRIERSQKLIDISFSTKNQETFVLSKLSPQSTPMLSSEKEQRIQDFFYKELQETTHFTVTFHNLITYNDLGERHQSIEMFNEFSKDAKITIQFNSKDFTNKNAFKEVIPIHGFEIFKRLEEANSEQSFPVEDKLEIQKIRLDNPSVTTYDSIATTLTSTGKTLQNIGGKVTCQLERVKNNIADNISDFSKKYQAWKFDYMKATEILLDLNMTFDNRTQSQPVKELLSINPSSVSTFTVKFFDATYQLVCLVMKLSENELNSIHPDCCKIEKNHYQNERGKIQRKRILHKDDIKKIVDNDNNNHKNLYEITLEINAKTLLNLLDKIQIDMQKEFEKHHEHNNKPHEYDKIEVNAQRLLSFSQLQLCFNRITQNKASDLIDKYFDLCNCDIRFPELSINGATSVVYLAGEKMNHAKTSIDLTNIDSLRLIINELNKKEEHLQINHRFIESSLKAISGSQRFLTECIANGHFYIYDAIEKYPLPWRSVLALATLSVAEVAGGVALLMTAPFTAGVSIPFGFYFIGESITDVIRTVMTLYFREFNVQSFLQEKAIATAISFSLIGIFHLAVSTSMSAAKGATLARRGLKFTLTHSDDMSQAMLSFFKLLSKRFAVEVARRTATIAVSSAVATSGHKVLSFVRPEVSRIVEQSVIRVFATDSCRRVTNNIIAYDVCFNTCEQQQKFIERVRQDICNIDVNSLNYSPFHFAHAFEDLFIDILKTQEEQLPSFCYIISKKLKELSFVSESFFNEIIRSVEEGWILVDNQFNDIRFREEFYEYLLDLDERQIKNIINLFTDYINLHQEEFVLRRRALQKDIIRLLTEKMMSKLNPAVYNVTELVSALTNVGINYGFDRLAYKINRAAISFTTDENIPQKQLETIKNYELKKMNAASSYLRPMNTNQDYNEESISHDNFEIQRQLAEKEFHEGELKLKESKYYEANLHFLKAKAIYQGFYESILSDEEKQKLTQLCDPDGKYSTTKLVEAERELTTYELVKDAEKFSESENCWPQQQSHLIIEPFAEAASTDDATKSEQLGQSTVGEHGCAVTGAKTKTEKPLNPSYGYPKQLQSSQQMKIDLIYDSFDDPRKYNDNDITDYKELMVRRKLGGYKTMLESNTCQFLLSNKFTDKHDRREYFVAVTDAVDTAGTTPIDYFFDKSHQVKSPIARALYIIIPVLDGLNRMQDDILRKELKEYLDINDYDNTFRENILSKLKEAHFDKVLLEALILEAEEQFQTRDVFDELIPVMLNIDKFHAKILFPYNITNIHWLSAEIIILKDKHDYAIEIYAHDPYGGGKMCDENYQTLKSTIERRIVAEDKEASVASINQSSPYTRRQAKGDAVSCGIITAEDIIKRIQGQSLNIEHLYEYGALQLRGKHCAVFDEANDNPTKERFLGRFKAGKIAIASRQKALPSTQQPGVSNATFSPDEKTKLVKLLYKLTNIKLKSAIINAMWNRELYDAGDGSYLILVKSAIEDTPILLRSQNIELDVKDIKAINQIHWVLFNRAIGEDAIYNVAYEFLQQHEQVLPPNSGILSKKIPEFQPHHTRYSFNGKKSTTTDIQEVSNAGETDGVNDAAECSSKHTP